jgi:hypothetical protein
MRARRPSADGDAWASPTVIATPAVGVRHWRLVRRECGSHLTQRSVPRSLRRGTVTLPTRRRHPHARRWPQADKAEACGGGEDRHASGPDQESDDDKDDAQEHLPLEELDDSSDHEDHRDDPQDGCQGPLLPGGRRSDTPRGTICRRRTSYRHGADRRERRARRLGPIFYGSPRPAEGSHLDAHIASVASCAASTVSKRPTVVMGEGRAGPRAARRRANGHRRR